MKKIVLFVFIFCLSLSNVTYSQIIQDCRESKKKFDNSSKFTTLTPVTINEMSELLKNDKKINIILLILLDF